MITFRKKQSGSSNNNRNYCDSHMDYATSLARIEAENLIILVVLGILAVKLWG